MEKQNLQRFLRRREVTAMTGLPASSLYELIAKELFPKSFRLSARAVAWDSREVEMWMQDRIAERDGAVDKEAA